MKAHTKRSAIALATGALMLTGVSCGLYTDAAEASALQELRAAKEVERAYERAHPDYEVIASCDKRGATAHCEYAGENSNRSVHTLSLCTVSGEATVSKKGAIAHLRVRLGHEQSACFGIGPRKFPDVRT